MCEGQKFSTPCSCSISQAVSTEEAIEEGILEVTRLHHSLALSFVTPR